MIRIYLLVAVTMLIAAAAGAQDHGYTPADIENGGRLSQASCGGCHAQDGAGVSGIELARGQFRRGTSDTDLIKIIQTGIPGTAMPPHNFTDAQAATVVAYLRNMATVRQRARRPRCFAALETRRAAGRSSRGKGSARPAIASTEKGRGWRRT